MVELKHVTLRYGAEDAAQAENCLSDFSLTVPDGEFLLLTGPSGCGKTTVLRLINGLCPHFYPCRIEGDVLIAGESVGGRELYDTALNVGTVFQNPRTQFYNVDTTGELAFSCENRGMGEKEIHRRIDGAVARFHIESLMDRSIFHLSGGEKQKIACASIDTAGQEIVLLDEPSANLDYAAAMNLRELIRSWRRQGKTIIAAEHRIAYLWDMIDRAVILNKGKIVRELRGKEKDALSGAELTAMGLRSTVSENPEQIPLPSTLDGDTPMTLRDFSFSYPGESKRVVELTELSLAAGEITAVTGVNGSGKTTFLNCFCGLEKRCGGTLDYQGRSYGRKARQKLCYMVMQDTGNQLFTESVLDEVLISLPAGEEGGEERAMEILRRMDLDAFSDRHPQSLSGGQKQRLAIACAIASGRRVLLLDEPTSGLDHAHMTEVSDILKQLREMGATVLVVTHDSELIHACCTRKITV